jgi:VWFA-related protein
MKTHQRIASHVLWFVIFLIVLTLITPIAAQSATVKLIGFDAGKFPTVRAFVSVTDSAGRAITLLKQDSFKIVEDGRDAKIVALNVSNEPIYVGLVIDRSGSMGQQNKLRDALIAANAFVDEMRAQDEAFVTMFDDTTTPLQDFTSDPSTLKNAIGRIRDGGGTAFYDATYASAEKFKPRQDKIKKALILLTDGLDNREAGGGLFGLGGAGSKHTLDQAIARAQEYQVAVYTIGLGRDADQARLQRLANETGGKFFLAPSGDDLKRLYLLIAEQLQKDYAVDFTTPRNVADGTRRNVRVTVTLPDGTTQIVDGVYVAGYLFNRIHANWIVGVLLGLMLLTLGVAPAGLRLVFGAASPTAPPVAPGLLCPRCHQSVRVGARFCAHCQQLLGNAPTLQCPHCGAPARAGARFCGTCRFKLS